MTRHRADLLSLFFGLSFAAIGLLLLSGGAGTVSLTWLGPLVAVALGTVLLFAARSAHRRADERPPEGDQ